jgi:hypothetical protein
MYTCACYTKQIATAQRTDLSFAGIITALESTAPSKLTRNEYALSAGLLSRKGDSFRFVVDRTHRVPCATVREYEQ